MITRAIFGHRSISCGLRGSWLVGESGSTPLLRAVNVALRAVNIALRAFKVALVTRSGLGVGFDFQSLLSMLNKKLDPLISNKVGFFIFKIQVYMKRSGFFI